MNEFLNTEMHNSVSIFNYLFQNKIPSYAFLEDGTKLKGTLIGWDDNYLLLLDVETVHLLSLKRLLRLEATSTSIATAANIYEKENSKPEVPRPKIAAAFNEITEIKEPEQTEKENPAAANKQSKDRLDQLVRNW